MRTRAKETGRTPSASGPGRPNTALSGLKAREHPLLHVQRTLGNQAVTRILRTHAGDSNSTLRRQEDSGGSIIAPPESPVELTPRGKYSGFEGDRLRNLLWDIADQGEKRYVTYRNAISRSTAIEKRVALNTMLLARLRDTLDHLSFARCVESLGRRAPTFKELLKNPLVAEAIESAWKSSDVGTRDLVTQPHEEGGWIFLNLIDGTLQIERATPTGTNFIMLHPAPDVADSVLVAVFHTHPQIGGPYAKPSRQDTRRDHLDGVPDLVVGNTGTNPKVFQVYLSGPPVRKHLASSSKYPGPSGGIPP